MQYVGLDVHKRYTFYTQMGGDGQIQRQGRVPNDQDTLATFFAEIPKPARAVLEAGVHWYYLCDLLEALQIPFTLANPLRTRAIAEAKVKTDKVDSTILAHLLRADLIPASYVPPQPLRDLRDLLRYRAALVRVQTGLKNRVHAILRKHGYHCPQTDTFGRQGKTWLTTLPLRAIHRQAVEGFLAVLATVQHQIQDATRLINAEARQTPQAQALCKLPGVGPYTALLILAEIGDVGRFSTPKHLVSYAGLAPTVHASGGHVYTGHISKRGSAWLRWILVEAAIHAVQQPGRYREHYQRLQARKGAKIARVAVARVLLTDVYWVLRRMAQTESSGLPVL